MVWTPLKERTDKAINRFGGHHSSPDKPSADDAPWSCVGERRHGGKSAKAFDADARLSDVLRSFGGERIPGDGAAPAATATLVSKRVGLPTCVVFPLFLFPAISTMCLLLRSLLEVCRALPPMSRLDLNLAGESTIVEADMLCGEKGGLDSNGGDLPRPGVISQRDAEIGRASDSVEDGFRPTADEPFSTLALGYPGGSSLLLFVPCSPLLLLI